VAHYNRTEVDRRLERLTGAYDPLVEEESVTVDGETFDSFVRRADDGYAGGGYAWVVREEPVPLSESMPEVEESYPQVLLALVRGADGWGPAGGGREDGEAYEEAAGREVLEETGIEREVVGCRRVERATLRPDREGSVDAVHTLWPYFVARATGGSIDIQESELDGAAWFHGLPERLQSSVQNHPMDVGGPGPGHRPLVLDELEEHPTRVLGVEEGHLVPPRAGSRFLVDECDAGVTGSVEGRVDVLGGDGEMVYPGTVAVEVAGDGPAVGRFEEFEEAVT
jgi:ADP-ribose pyrophosphatase YjhB (NUDIX family)